MTPARAVRARAAQVPVICLLGAQLALLVPAVSSAGAQELARDRSGDFELTVSRIMRGPELVGESPDSVRWTDDGRWIYFRWKPGGESWHEDRSLYRVDVESGESEKLSEGEADSLGILVAEGDLSEDGTRRVVAHRGDLYLIDTADLSTRRLTDTAAPERSPTFGRRSGSVYFVREGEETANLFALGLESGSVRQLTDLRPGPEPEEEEESEGHRRFLEEQQQELFDHLRREKRKREEREEREEVRKAEEPEAVYLARSERVVELVAGPDGRHAVLRVLREPREERSTLVPDYVTESGYTDTRETRTKVGDSQTEPRLGRVDLETGAVEWLELGPGEPDQEEEAEPRLAAARFLGWNADGTAGLVGAVSYDHKEQWLYSLDAATGELALVTRDEDEAWIDGPCGPWLNDSCAGWLPDGERIFFISERDGYAHLYLTRPGEEPRQLTSGDWEVHAARVSRDEANFGLTASRRTPFERHYYSLPVDGGDLTKITRRSGRNEATPSPDGSLLAVVHSSANVPPELYLMDNRPDGESERLTRSPTEEWLGFPWIEPEIVDFEARDGERVPARIYRPEELGARKNGAGVIFVHGAGYLQNVHRWWSSYYREYMFHHLLAARGYTVLDIDYRGSAGYGRDWRTAVYRRMGGQDLTDQLDGAHHLIEAEGVDPDRVGIYGGSYGGFITLMALFRHPGTFAAGAALRSVTDWAHYNHPYTSRILNLPGDDDEAYRRSSPIYFAEGLEDPLLIAHGMVDSNVHFQDVVRLAQRLIALGKEDWEMAVYPAEGHAFEDPDSWTDEYRRILALFERHLRQRPEGG